MAHQANQARNSERCTRPFTASLLPPGTYTAALTCTAADVPGSKSMDFTPTQDAVVTVGGNTFLTF